MPPSYGVAPGRQPGRRSFWLWQLPLVLGVLLTCSVGHAGKVDVTATAGAVVDRLHQTLLQAMQDGRSLGFAGRYAIIAPVIEASHDFEVVARLVLQPAWRDLDEPQRAAAVAAIRHLSIATYANRFVQYSGERFEVVDAVESAAGQAQVVATLTTATRREVAFEYLLFHEKGSWRIINILADGVSDLALKRAEYGRIMREQGFTGLLERLKEQAEALAAGAEPWRR